MQANFANGRVEEFLLDQNLSAAQMRTPKIAAITGRCLPADAVTADLAAQDHARDDLKHSQEHQHDLGQACSKTSCFCLTVASIEPRVKRNCISCLRLRLQRPCTRSLSVCSCTGAALACFHFTSLPRLHTIKQALNGTDLGWASP